MLRLDVQHAKTMTFQIVNGAERGFGQKSLGGTSSYSERLGGLNRIQPFNPTVEEDVLPKHVEFDFGMPRPLRRHLAFQPPDLPILKLFGRHIDCEWSFS